MSSPTRTTIPPPIAISSFKLSAAAKGRARSSSIVAVQEVGGDGAEEVLDQSVYRNRNSDWVNGKGTCCPATGIEGLLDYRRVIGAWIIHPTLTLAAKIIIDVLPGVTQEASWTIVNLGYLLVGARPSVNDYARD